MRNMEEEYQKLLAEVEILKRARKEDPLNESLTKEISEKEARIFKIVKLQSRRLRKFLDLYRDEHFKDDKDYGITG